MRLAVEDERAEEEDRAEVERPAAADREDVPDVRSEEAAARVCASDAPREALAKRSVPFAAANGSLTLRLGIVFGCGRAAPGETVVVVIQRYYSNAEKESQHICSLFL